MDCLKYFSLLCYSLWPTVDDQPWQPESMEQWRLMYPVQEAYLRLSLVHDACAPSSLLIAREHFVTKYTITDVREEGLMMWLRSCFSSSWSQSLSALQSVGQCRCGLQIWLGLRLKWTQTRLIWRDETVIDNHFIGNIEHQGQGSPTEFPRLLPIVQCDNPAKGKLETFLYHHAKPFSRPQLIFQASKVEMLCNVKVVVNFISKCKLYLLQ